MRPRDEQKERLRRKLNLGTVIVPPYIRYMDQCRWMEIHPAAWGKNMSNLYLSNPLVRDGEANLSCFWSETGKGFLDPNRSPPPKLFQVLFRAFFVRLVAY